MRRNRCEDVLEEYSRAPQLILSFPASGQTWRLRLTPHLRRRIAADVGPMVRVHRAGRGWRRRAARVRASWRLDGVTTGG